MSRRTAAIAGLVAWLALLLWAPEKTPRAMAIWGAICALAVVVSIVAARVLARALRDAVVKDQR